MSDFDSLGSTTSLLEHFGGGSADGMNDHANTDPSQRIDFPLPTTLKFEAQEDNGSNQPLTISPATLLSQTNATEQTQSDNKYSMQKPTTSTTERVR